MLLALAAVAPLAACGSSKAPSTSTTPAATPTTPAASTPAPSPPTSAAKKTGAHASHGRGRSRANAVSDRAYALVPRHGLFLLGALHSSTSPALRVLGKEHKVCWSVAPGLAHKTAGQIDTGAPGTTDVTVLGLGKVYEASGCVPAKASVLDDLVRYPAAYYVSVDGGV